MSASQEVPSRQIVHLGDGIDISALPTHERARVLVGPSKDFLKLSALPNLQPVEIRPGRHVNLDGSMRPTNVKAVLIQSAGVEAKNACERCVNAAGPFVGCKVVSGMVHGICGNCYYNQRGRVCSFVQNNRKARKQRESKNKDAKDKKEEVKQAEVNDK